MISSISFTQTSPNCLALECFHNIFIFIISFNSHINSGTDSITAIFMTSVRERKPFHKVTKLSRTEAQLGTQTSYPPAWSVLCHILGGNNLSFDIEHTGVGILSLN